MRNNYLMWMYRIYTLLIVFASTKERLWHSQGSCLECSDVQDNQCQMKPRPWEGFFFHIQFPLEAQAPFNLRCVLATSFMVYPDTEWLNCWDFCHCFTTNLDFFINSHYPREPFSPAIIYLSVMNPHPQETNTGGWPFRGSSADEDLNPWLRSWLGW